MDFHYLFRNSLTLSKSSIFFFQSSYQQSFIGFSMSIYGICFQHISMVGFQCLFITSHFRRNRITSRFFIYHSFWYVFLQNPVGFGHIFFHSSRGFFGWCVSCHFFQAFCFTAIRLGFFALSFSQQLVQSHRPLCLNFTPLHSIQWL